MTQTVDFSLVPGEAGATLVLSGPMTVAGMGTLDPRLRAIEERVTRIDLTQVPMMDTVGAWVCHRLARQWDAQIVHPCESAQRLIGALRQIDDGNPPEPTHRLPVWLRVPEKVGDAVIGQARGALEVIGFLGQMVLAAGTLLRHPSRFRMLALVHQMELVGVNALAIIGLMSFLVGIVIAQQGAVQLQQFGAEIYTINLTGRIAFRELGVLMTAIMVAGRSGSAFAAQIGTMKLTEEVDAMRTIGLSPMDVLVLPRVIASVVMLTLMGFYSAVVSIIGGAVLGQLVLDIPFLTFLNRVQEVVPIHDLWVGLIKGPVFGLIIGMTGCYQGMKVSGNSEDVGLRTTKAVVHGIFMVIVLDAFFAVFFSKIGWM